MNLVFMNSLEKKMEDNRVKTGQVSICEQKGQWMVFWNEPASDGKVHQEEWYEGSGWEEMFRAYKFRITEKLGEGYMPMLDGVADQFGTPRGRDKYLQMILCYSDLNRNEQLYEKLRDWRRGVAMRQNKAAYMIATNRMLGMVSAFVPRTREELQQLPGFGANKVKSYGEDIIAITKHYSRQTVFPLDWVTEQIEKRKFARWYFQQKQNRLKQEEDLREGKKKILAAIENGDMISDIEKTCNLTNRELLDRLEQLADEGCEFTDWLDQQLSENNWDHEAASKAMAEKGDKYLKPILQEVFNGEELKSVNTSEVYAWLRLLRIRGRLQQQQ